MMYQGEKDVPSRHALPASNAACAKARARIQGFLDGDRPLSDDAALRVHLERCTDCNEHYRERLLFVARIGRERRRLRETERDAPELPVDVQREGKLKRFRAIVVPFALLAALGLLFTRDGVPATVAGRVLAGRATVGGREFDAEVARDVQRGEWLETERDARLALESEGTRIELDGATRLLVEEPRERRFRLDGGSIAVEGACALRGEFGALDCRGGRARVTLAAGVLTLESETAELELVDSRGSQRVAPGERLEVSLRRR